MDEFSIVRSMALRLGERARGGRLERSLAEWLAGEEDWLALGCAEDASLFVRLAALRACHCATDEGEAPVALATARAIASLLGMEDRDTALFTLAVARERLGRVRSLACVATDARIGQCEALGFALPDAPANATGQFRASAMVRLGLVNLRGDGEAPALDLDWRAARLFDTVEATEEALLEALGGPVRTTALTMADFAHVEDARLIADLLAGASLRHAKGVHILIHGPPGTGKTELAKVVAAEAGLTLHAVGETDSDGDEPTRFERLCALGVAQRIAERRPNSALLFDELEDMAVDRSGSSRRAGSKVWINRMMEDGPVPVIWTSNRIDDVDPATLRRMTFVLRLDFPPASAARTMLERIASDEDVAVDEALIRMAERAPSTASVFRPAMRAKALIGDGTACQAAERTARSLVKAMGSDPDVDGFGNFDPGLFETDRPVDEILERLVTSRVDDVSLLLTGSPGTGKSALAHALAKAMDRPLVTKRASDLLSKWVGETEAAIAEAFAEARRRGSILLLDEVDSLLRDRSLASAGWEISQVNELLTWLDRHPLPVVAATNCMDRLDPAAMRRFVFKIHFRPLGSEKTRRAFEHFFGEPAPKSLDRLQGLTPGDFSVVSRRRRLMPGIGPEALVDELAAELAARPGAGTRIGF